MEDKIYKLLLEKDIPLTTIEIAEAVGCNRLKKIKIALDRLHDNGKIIVIHSEIKPYYRVANNENNKEKESIRDYVDNKIIKLGDRVDELNGEIKRLDRKIKNNYINMIEIIGVFVAIFSILVNNSLQVRVEKSTVSSNEIRSFVDFIKDPFIVSNLVMIAGIIIMLVAIKLVIVSDKKENL